MKRIACFILCLVLVVAVVSGCALKKMTFKEADEAGTAFMKENGLKNIQIVFSGKIGDDVIRTVIEGSYDPAADNAVFSVSYENDDKIETYKDMIKITGGKLYVKIVELPSLSSLSNLGASLTVSETPVLKVSAKMSAGAEQDENGEENRAESGLDLSSILALLGETTTDPVGSDLNSSLDLSSILALLGETTTDPGESGLSNSLDLSSILTLLGGSGMDQSGSDLNSSTDLSSILGLLGGSGTSLSGLDVSSLLESLSGLYTGATELGGDETNSDELEQILNGFKQNASDPDQNGSGLDLSSILALLGASDADTKENHPTVGAGRPSGSDTAGGLGVLSRLNDIVGKYVEIDLPETKPGTIGDIIDSILSDSYDKAETLEGEEDYPYIVKFNKNDARDLLISALDGIKEKKADVLAEIKSLISGAADKENIESIENVTGKTVDELLSNVFDSFFEENKPEDITLDDISDFEFVRRLAFEKGKRFESVNTLKATGKENTPDVDIRFSVKVTSAEADAAFSEKCAVPDDQVFDVNGFINDLKDSFSAIF